MTKERKLAIGMWEYILQHLGEKRIGALKSDYLKLMNEPKDKWLNACWFCQYCRRDWNPNIPGRENISRDRNNCRLCPIYKYELEQGDIPDEDEDICGCDTEYDTLYDKIVHYDNVSAAETILALLKGEV